MAAATATAAVAAATATAVAAATATAAMAAATTAGSPRAVPQAGAQMQSPYRSVAAAEPTRSHLLTILLSKGWSGMLGFDRFYPVRSEPMLKAVTGGFGIWALYDLFMSAAGNRTDVERLVGWVVKRDPTMLLIYPHLSSFRTDVSTSSVD